MSALSFGVLCFSSLFTIIDPVGVAPVFVTLARGRSAAEGRRLALRACLVALGVLLVFAVSGAFLFRIFGITIDAFRIGGGILFVALGIQMLGSSGHEGAAGDAAAGRDDGDPAVVPLGIPLIGGPGAITTVMVLMGQAEDAVQTAVLLTALVLALAVTLGVLLLAPIFTRRLGRAGLQLVTKVMGLIVLVIGVQFVVDGIRPIAVDILRSAAGG